MRTLFAFFGALIFIGCSSVQVQDYKGEKPVLHLEQYLNGDIEAHGMFEDRSGKIVKRFHVKMKATWIGDTGTLDEYFSYSDGTNSRRIWTLKKVGADKYTGTAADVVGTATGEVAGNAFHWNYILNLPVDDKTYHVKFDDWMYLMDDKIMLNKSKMSKFGIYLGQVTLTFIKK